MADQVPNLEQAAPPAAPPVAPIVAVNAPPLTKPSALAKLLPEFCGDKGESPTAWLDRCARLFRGDDIADDILRINSAVVHLERAASERWKTMESDASAAGAPTTWADLRHRLVGHFELGNSAFKVRDQIQKVIRQAKQNAFVDVNSYYLAISVNLANLPAESERAYLFYQGLHPRIRALLPTIMDNGTPYTLLELAQRAMNLEHQIQPMTHERPPSSNPRRPYQPHRSQEPRASRRPRPSSETPHSSRRGSRRP